MFITVLVSATEWENFYGRRCEKDAQPEIQKAAYLMRDAMEASKPVQRIHHFPFIDFIDHEWVEANYPTHEIETLSRLSVARCARVSYLTHDGVHDPEADLALAGRLAAAGHWSPFEHVAMAAADATKFYANFRGWKQYRSTFPGESGTTYEKRSV
jgi:thymidylate synthase ThyX